MKIIKENDNELLISLNPLRDIDLISVTILIALLIYCAVFGDGMSLIDIPGFYLFLLACIILPGFLWFSIFPIKIYINKQSGILQVTSIFSFNYTPITISINAIKTIDYKGSGYDNVLTERGFLPIPEWGLIPCMKIILVNNQNIYIYSYILTFPAITKLGKKITTFLDIHNK